MWSGMLTGSGMLLGLGCCWGWDADAVWDADGVLADFGAGSLCRATISIYCV